MGQQVGEEARGQRERASEVNKGIERERERWMDGVGNRTVVWLVT